MQGIETYRTVEDFKVVRLHYTADPEKTTDQWFVEALKGYPGGKGGIRWRKEMEIDFTAYSGQLLCYDLLQNHRSKIIRHYQIKDNYYKFGSLDWGRNNPASFHIYIVGENKHIHSEYEIYQRDISVSAFSNLIKQSPYYQELRWISADPSIMNKTQETKEGLRSLADLFQDEGITLRKGKSRDDNLAINELLDRWYELEVNEPTFTISPKCPMQIWEFERLRYKEITTSMIEKQNPSEQLIDKDNHSWDDWKYFISTWLTEPKAERPKILKDSVAWEMMKDEQESKDWRSKYAIR